MLGYHCDMCKDGSFNLQVSFTHLFGEYVFHKILHCYELETSKWFSSQLLLVFFTTNLINYQESNADGCTKCYCSGKATRCYSAGYVNSPVYEMSNWTLVDIKTSDEVLSVNPLPVLVEDVDGKNGNSQASIDKQVV